MNKQESARILKEIAFFMRFNGGSPSLAKQYHKASQALLSWPGELTVPVQTDELARVPHIGHTMALVIAELVLTGVSAFHQQMRDEYPSSLAELGDIPGLTPKHIYLLYHRAGVRSLADLRLAIHHTKQILSIPGFGPSVLARLCQAFNECLPEG